MRPIAWLAALLAIGDGVVTVAMPRRHVRRWTGGPSWYRQMMRPFAEHPASTRVLGAAQAAVALWWTSRIGDRPT